jgi:hypothetical protein
VLLECEAFMGQTVRLLTQVSFHVSVLHSSSGSHNYRAKSKNPAIQNTTALFLIPLHTSANPMVFVVLRNFGFLKNLISAIAII